MSEPAAIGWKRIARRTASPAILCLAAAVATLPQMIYGYSCGHDFDFHLLSWFEALHSWRHGLFYPHWAITPNYGAGEPRFVFYPPLTWMLGAALRLVMGWGSVPVTLVFLMLAGTGLGTLALARELLDEGAATLAGCVAIFSGYALFTAYERSAFGELTGGFWIPLLLKFTLRDRNPSGRALSRALDGSALPLACVMAGVWLSNIPLGIMAAYLLAAVALPAALLKRSWAPVVRAAMGAVLGIGLASIYLFPAAWEQRWVDVSQAINDPGSRIESSWLFARHSDPSLEDHDTVLLKASIIAATMLAVAFAGLVVAWLRGRLRTNRDWWMVLALIPLAIAILQFPVSRPIWDLVPRLRLLQFPWRWLVVLEAPMAIAFAAALWPARLRRQIDLAILCCLMFAAATYFAERVLLQVCDVDDSISGMLGVYASGAGYAGIDEYAPPSADDSLVATGLPGACLVADAKTVLGVPVPDDNPEWDADQHSCKATYAAAWTAPEHLRIAAPIGQAGYLILRLRSYPAWKVTVNGMPVTALPQREDGLMAIPVTPGPADLEVRWNTTPDVIAGRWLSGVALLCFIALWLTERRRRTHSPPRLS
jgi:hypothetical protein